LLHTTFLQHYPSCHTAKVVTDPTTGLSRGYGFVRFIDESEQKRAMHEMQGQYCGARPMRISVATPKNRVGGGCWSALPGTWSAPNMYHDPTNTTVFVGGLVNGYVSEEDLAK
jgi:RNA recognition motif-containing protein